MSYISEIRADLVPEKRHRRIPYGGTGVIPYMRKGNQVYLFLEKRTDIQGVKVCFSPFGGGIDLRVETYPQCANRELYEEFGMGLPKETPKEKIKNVFKLVGVYGGGDPHHVTYDNDDEVDSTVVGHITNVAKLEGKAGTGESEVVRFRIEQLRDLFENRRELFFKNNWDFLEEVLDPTRESELFV